VGQDQGSKKMLAVHRGFGPYDNGSNNYMEPLNFSVIFKGQSGFTWHTASEPDL